MLAATRQSGRAALSKRPAHDLHRHQEALHRAGRDCVMRQPSPAELAKQLDADTQRLTERLTRGEGRFAAIEDKLDRLIEAVSSIPAIQADLAAVKKDAAETKEIVEAWAAVKTMGKFLKWASGVIAALAAIGAAIKVSAIHFLR